MSNTLEQWRRVEGVKSSSSFLTAALTATLFIPLAFGGRSVGTLLAPIALVGLLALFYHSAPRALVSSLLTPFLPVLVVFLLVAPFQETVTEALHLVAVFLVYVFSRWTRLAIPVHWLAFGIASSALAVGIIRQLSLTSFGGDGTLIWKIADINGRNPAGMAVGFGLVAAVVLLIRFAGSRVLGAGALVLSFSLLVLVLLSDTVAMVIAAGAALFSIGLVSLVITLKRGALSAAMRPVSWVLFGGALVVAAAVAIANLVPSLQGGSLSFLQRDFSSITGRTNIWNCYYDAVADGASKRWEATVECLGWPAAHLHSIFLQSHLLADVVGLVLMVFAFVTLIAFSFRKAIQSQTIAQLTNHLFSLGLTVAGLVLGLVESYLITLFFSALVVFMAAEPPTNNSFRGVIVGYFAAERPSKTNA